MFSKSTVRALKFYDNSDWSITAQIVEFIVELWKILNIKTPYKDKTTTLIIFCLEKFCQTSLKLVLADIDR